jgi:RNA polymerase primary sigma factor
MWDENEMGGLSALDPSTTEVLSAQEERRLLGELAKCKAKLAESLAKLTGSAVPKGADAPQDLAEYIVNTYEQSAQAQARLGAIYHRYDELRTRLALANLRLVAHVAKRFRERGVALSDLIQEGFCGLLEAIDRFDIGHETKLSTYATWWIRQAMQRAVASGAYPVRLSPRHLRQLAISQDEHESPSSKHALSPKRRLPSTEMIERIHTATRPTVSLDATLETDTDFSLLQTMSDHDADHREEVEMGETIGRLMKELPDREKMVLSLRFGLGGSPKLSLSQVGQVLEVSKERVRQIQEHALERLRSAASLSEEVAVLEAS